MAILWITGCDLEASRIWGKSEIPITAGSKKQHVTGSWGEPVEIPMESLNFLSVAWEAKINSKQINEKQKNVKHEGYGQDG